MQPERDHSPLDRDEMEALSDQVRSESQHFSVRVDEEENALYLSLDSSRTPAKAVIDLQSVDPGTSVAVRVAANDGQEVTIRNLDPDARATIAARATHRSTAATISLADGVAGTITIDSELPVLLRIDEGAAPRVLLRRGELSIEEAGGTYELAVHGRSESPPMLTGQDFHLVEVRGTCGLSRGTTVADLLVPDTGVLHVEQQASITNIRGESAGSILQIRPVAAETGARDQQISLSTSRLHNVTIIATEAIAISGVDEASNTSFNGGVAFILRPGGKAEKIHFSTDDGQTPLFSAGPKSVAASVSGEVRIGQWQGATVDGAPKSGFLIVGIGKDQNGSKNRCEEAIVTNFSVPEGIEGRRLLNQFDDAHRLEPQTEGLPGWDLRWKRAGSSRRATPGSDQLRDLRFDAELVRKLADLASAKGTSGSARTKVAWCAQRLRHEVTTGPIERGMLTAYRSLGYGERPGPPFATWLIASLVLAWILAQSGGEDYTNVLAGLRLWAERAISPIGSVIGTGSGTEDASWLYLLRAIVAIPLIVGALALRKYVRAT